MLIERISTRGWKSRIFSGLLLGLGLVASVNAIPYGTMTDDYSYVGAVGLRDNGGSVYVLGSGVLIAPDVVLTAGHVVQEVNRYSAPLFPVFVTGADPVQQDPETVTDSENTVLHPLYRSGETGQYDIALIFLRNSVGLEQYAALSSESGVALTGEAVDIVGYGGAQRRETANRIDTTSTAGELLYVVDNFPVVETGDSGGGLFVEREGQDRLAGITSWTRVGRNGESLAAFTSVSYYRDFIDQYVPAAVWRPATAVSEPGTALILGLGLAGLFVNRKILVGPPGVEPGTNGL